MNIMGLDIGGANIDCAIITLNEKKVEKITTKREYFPMWKERKNLEKCLQKFITTNIDVVTVTMTAELSDSYESKIEGILDISKKVDNVFDCDKYFISTEGIKTYNEVIKNPSPVAAANWKATAEFIKYIEKDCIFMDIGSTTTDIIPLKDMKEIAHGRCDTTRLQSGELVYTGMLRTNLATITHTVPVNNIKTRVSSELFAITADIHHILGNITEEDYTCNTPDNNKKDVTSCKRRLSRLVCGDLDTINDKEIIKIAKYLEDKQIKQIESGLKQVYDRTDIKTVLVTSIGEANLCQKAANNLGLKVISLEEYMPKKTTNVLTAIGAIQAYLDYKKMNIKLIDKMY